MRISRPASQGLRFLSQLRPWIRRAAAANPARTAEAYVSTDPELSGANRTAVWLVVQSGLERRQSLGCAPPRRLLHRAWGILPIRAIRCPQLALCCLKSIAS